MRKICLIFIINYSLLITNSYSQWITWQRTYGEQGTDYAYSVVQLPDDGFMAVGRKLNSANLIRTNKFGVTLWTRVYASGEFVCIQKTSDSNYIICSVAGNIFKVDINGNII